MPNFYPLFVLAVSLLILTPGPNVALIVANSVAYGARYGLLTVVGTVTATAVHMLFVGFGLGLGRGRDGGECGRRCRCRRALPAQRGRAILWRPCKHPSSV